MYKAIIFDFDYTLANSSKGVIESMNYSFNKMGLPDQDPLKICKTIGLPLRESFQNLTGIDDQKKADRFYDLFKIRADQVMEGLTIIFEEVPETIKKLKDKNLLLGIVSTKFRYRINDILARDGLLEYFDVIIGGEDVKINKPDPEGLLKAMDIMKLDKTECLYAGDSITDAKTAKRADVKFTAVLSGTTEVSEFNQYNPEIIIANVSYLISNL